MKPPAGGFGVTAPARIRWTTIGSKPRPERHASISFGVWLWTAGRVNFLFDKSRIPTMTADELCSPFGVSKSTGSAKSTAILKWLNSHQGDPNWTLPSRLGDNPLARMIRVNGFVLDARTAPRDRQEEALRLGSIPYLP
ncbi:MULTISPECIES: DUF6398 domain-containing protein [unclassified Thiocapsa]|uniref:DUF6398 domain-containing protein n=1 Tax=unclassified Thiocapsa TaxID=2641286 RepID=UPI0035B3D196